MGSKGLKIAFIAMLFPIIGMAQGIAFRKADTALVTNDAGALRVFKSQPYYSSLLALKVKYTDTLTKIATKANLLPYALISNSVLLTGNQTVSGIKTFSSSIVGNGLTSTGLLTTKAGSSSTYPVLGTTSGQFRLISFDGNYGIAISTWNDGNTWFQNMRFDGTPTAYNTIFNPAGGKLIIGPSAGVDANTGVLQVYGNAGGNTDATLAAHYTRKNQVDAALALKVNTSSILSATATLDFPNVAASQNATLTISVTGASVGDAVSIGLPNSLLTGLAWNASFITWVSSTNTISVRFQNNDLVNPHDLASASFTVKVLK